VERVQENPRWRLKEIKLFEPPSPSRIFLKTFFLQNLLLTYTNPKQNLIENKLTISRVCYKNLILICHLGSIHHFWLFWQNMSSGHVAGQNINSCKRLNASLIFGRHLGHQTPS
jgi:hypothetical protein